MTGNYPVARNQAPGKPNPPGAGRAKPSSGTVLRPVSWLFVAVALVLIGVLTYYLTLTTRPEISQISPAPNSSQEPGPVTLEAIITSQRDLDDVRFTIDGESVAPTIENNGDNEWTATYEQVFERGERQIILEVVDSSGRTAEHSWTFESGGDLVPPRLALMSPPSGVILESGLNGLSIQATTFADIDEVIINLDGEPAEVEINESEPSTEYTAENGLPIFEWDISVITRLNGGQVSVDATVIDVYGASTSADWSLEVAADDADADARFFAETGEYAVEPFLSFWAENDGETIFGPPVSPPLRSDAGHTHQYYRYSRLELDNSGNVQLGLVGREIFGDPESPPDRPPGDGSRLFDPTGHYIYGVIRAFWEENGGLSIFGYPLSQEFDIEEGYAQYFERALFEVVEVNGEAEVRLAPLGERLYEEHQRGERRSVTEEPEDENAEDDN